MRWALHFLALSLVACAGELPRSGGLDLLFDATADGDVANDSRWAVGDQKSDVTTAGDASADARGQPDAGHAGPGAPPFGQSSGGSGGAVAPGGTELTAAGERYSLIVPRGYAGAKTPLLLIYSGVEGRAVMTQNMVSSASYLGLADVIIAVFDGRSAKATTGALALDQLRGSYNIDNDRTYLLSESAGTAAGMSLGFSLRQGYFAAYWANDITRGGSPEKSAAELSFAPWGNAGPGGQTAYAQAIVSAMRAKGYRLPVDAPYSGAGAGTHGHPDQFMAALRFFVGKARK